MINQQIPNNTPFVSKKISIKKIIIKLIVIFMCIYIFLWLEFGTTTPFVETCIQSDILAQDKINNNYIRYIECIKGYTETYGMGDAQRTVSQRTTGYVTFKNDGSILSTTALQKNNDVRLKKGIYPDFYFKDKNIFVTVTAGSDSSEGKMSDIKNEILIFENGNINKIRDVFFEWRYILKYENNEIYYINFENRKIIKENILTGKSSVIIDTNSIKKDELNYPVKVKFSKIEGNASIYNLQYEPNSQMDIYKILLFFKGSSPIGTSITDYN